jgi:glycosyltransferase involved in cell wall biosynthesis
LTTHDPHSSVAGPGQEASLFNGCSVAVVVPAHNEESLIGRTVATLPDFVDHVVVVDDGSADRTAERASVAAIARPDFSLVVHPQNRGVGAAIVSGYRRALQLRADLVVVVGADAQMDPADMGPLLQGLLESGGHYAKGNRMAFPGVLRAMPKVRLLGNLALTALTRLSSGYWQLQDAQCGYTAIRRDALQCLDLSRLYPRYGYPNDLLAHLSAQGRSLIQVPVRPIYASERSGLRPLRVALPMLALLARSGARRLWTQYGRPLRPRRLRSAATETA